MPSGHWCGIHWTAAVLVEELEAELGGPVGEVAGVTAVGPDPREPPEAALRRGQQDAGGVSVGRGGRRDQHAQEESEGVGEQVALASVDLLPGVETPRGVGDGRVRLHRLRVHDRRTRLLLTALGATDGSAQPVVQLGHQLLPRFQNRPHRRHLPPLRHLGQ